MIPAADYERIQNQLAECLKTVFDDVQVQIGDQIHYKGTNVVVTSRHFDGLLAEQRFHHVVRAVPKDLYEEYLQRGVVWFELTPDEAGIDLMRMARAVDVKNQAAAIEKSLGEINFFQSIRDYFAKEPERASLLRFEAVREVLKQAGFNEQEIERACLYLILQDAFCDAHVLTDLVPKHASGSAA